MRAHTLPTMHDRPPVDGGHPPAVAMVAFPYASVCLYLYEVAGIPARLSGGGPIPAASSASSKLGQLTWWDLVGQESSPTDRCVLVC